jgi:type IV secretory pathway TraG/TraD family ATPase VirD4
VAGTPGRNHQPRKKPRRSDPTSSPPSLSDGRLPQKAFQSQSLSRTKTPYPGYKNNGVASLLENAAAEIVFGTDNLDLIKEVSERSGYNTVKRISRTRPRFFSMFRSKEQSENTSETRRALILPQEVSSLPMDEEIVFRASAPPFKLKRLEWYADPNFKNLKQDPTEIPTITYRLSRDDGSIKLKGSQTA